jgi:hypothetical protein
MKKIIFFLLLFFVKYESYSQFNYKFEKIVELNGWECNVQGIKQTPDLGYIIGGSYVSGLPPNTVYGNFLLKLDKSGNTVWNKDLKSTINYHGLNGNSYIQGLSIDNNGNIYILTSGYSSSDTLYGDIEIIKTNSSGSLIWAKSFGDIDNAEAGDAIDLSGNDLYVSGYTRLNNSGPVLGYIVKIDTSGNMIWNRTIDNSGTLELRCIKGVYDNKIMAVSPEGYVVVVSKNGNILFSKKISCPYGPYLNSVTRYINNGYLFGGATSDASNGLHPILIAMDSTFNLLWTKKYNQPGITVSEFISINSTSDGNYIANYEPEPPNSSGHFFGLIKLTPSGQKIWAKMYSHGYQQMPEDLIETKDSGYASLGYIVGAQYYNKHPYILKTDRNGLTDSCKNDSVINITSQNVTSTLVPFGVIDSIGVANNTIFSLTDAILLDSIYCVDSVVDPYYKPLVIKNIYADEKEKIVSMYPNPATDYFYVDYYSDVSSDLIFTIYTMQGKAVKTLSNLPIKQGVNNFRIETNELHSGAYLFSLKTKEDTFTKQLIIIK